MYVYIRDKFEVCLFTVGFYDPNGGWHPDSDWNSQEDAAARVHWLNGNNGKPTDSLVEIADQLRELNNKIESFRSLVGNSINIYETGGR